jgi:hypothetical protein
MCFGVLLHHKESVIRLRARACMAASAPAAATRQIPSLSRHHSAPAHQQISASNATARGEAKACLRAPAARSRVEDVGARYVQQAQGAADGVDVEVCRGRRKHVARNEKRQLADAGYGLLGFGQERAHEELFRADETEKHLQSDALEHIVPECGKCIR